MYEDEGFTGLDKVGHAGHPRQRRPHSPRGAIYHFNARNGSRSKGQSARAAAAYIQREAEYSAGAELELVYTESAHMPSWAEAEPLAYWQAADQHERANGRLFKRVEVALPLALSADERRELAVGFAHHLTDAERLPYTLALHAGQGTNPHAHLLISERGNDGVERSPELWFRRYNAAEPERGGARKSRALQPKAWLEGAREAWAEQTNQALELAGHDVRIDHRSLEAQGIDRLPGLHLGPAVWAMEVREIETNRGDEARALTAAEIELRRKGVEVAREVAEIEREAVPARAATIDPPTAEPFELLYAALFDEPVERAVPSPAQEPPAPAEIERERIEQAAQAEQEGDGPCLALEYAKTAGEAALQLRELTNDQDKGAAIVGAVETAMVAWELSGKDQGSEEERAHAREIIDQTERSLRFSVKEIEDPQAQKEASLARERLYKSGVQEYRKERQAERVLERQQEREKERAREKERGPELEL